MLEQMCDSDIWAHVCHTYDADADLPNDNLEETNVLQISVQCGSQPPPACVPNGFAASLSDLQRGSLLDAYLAGLIDLDGLKATRDVFASRVRGGWVQIAPYHGLDMHPSFGLMKPQKPKAHIAACLVKTLVPGLKCETGETKPSIVTSKLGSGTGCGQQPEETHLIISSLLGPVTKGDMATVFAPENDLTVSGTTMDQKPPGNSASKDFLVSAVVNRIAVRQWMCICITARADFLERLAKCLNIEVAVFDEPVTAKPLIAALLLLHFSAALPMPAPLRNCSGGETTHL
ncbi:uncharacterized protein EV422DRAFT_529183 [Fimicolochytrium jonesii]|uniref:uncharacterized protein n=1 Tax=Fimicolochytrium jonesii TaxID=1396493 RepID=UPI0022FEB62A|nr:uncharacterized protein EV422DRAFT_529183 [Fimicolochytrium jonesii]KAI8821119.1 hypothetical protein EV422DRAFT_529183 [Fimicolochytrium jonesii]